jgi:uncharacterized protein
LGAGHINVLADLNVKHSAALAERPLEDEVADLVHRGGADAVIVSGSATGKRAHMRDVETAKAAAGPTRVFVGSGVTPETVADYLKSADGFIVGTAFKADGDVAQPVDPARVKALMRRL